MGYKQASEFQEQNAKHVAALAFLLEEFVIALYIVNYQSLISLPKCVV